MGLNCSTCAGEDKNYEFKDSEIVNPRDINKIFEKEPLKN